jgi:tol-pal system protein YbgF
MRLFIFLISFFIFNAVLAEDETEVVDLTEENADPTFEPITQDIGGRLDKVERVLNNKALLDMLELLESLKIEISTLRGEVEVQTHTIEQLKQKQRDLYTDIDGRIQRIESNQVPGDSAVSLYTDTVKDNGETTEETETPAITDEENVVADTSTEAVETEAVADEDEDEEPIDPLKAESVYQKAFKLLKESQYDQALVAFKKFLKDYPQSDFSDNAQYWLGEANYVKQNYEIAINEYQALLSTYPDSQKVSHALLKIGYSYAELGNAADAKKTLKEVKTQYPGTTAARLADERLRKIGSAKETNS